VSRRGEFRPGGDKVGLGSGVPAWADRDSLEVVLVNRIPARPEAAAWRSNPGQAGILLIQPSWVQRRRRPGGEVPARPRSSRSGPAGCSAEGGPMGRWPEAQPGSAKGPAGVKRCRPSRGWEQLGGRGRSPAQGAAGSSSRSRPRPGRGPANFLDLSGWLGSWSLGWY
jgi:hypothetical protein